MKDSACEKISNLAAKMRRIEPKWYLGWALGCALVGGLLGDVSFIVVGVMYLFLAEMARQRNEARAERDKWFLRTCEWIGLALSREDAHYRDMGLPNPRKQDKP